MQSAPTNFSHDPTLPLELAADASPYGLGAVILHVYDDGSSHPVAYASRSLTKHEKGYSELDKEALYLSCSVSSASAHTFTDGNLRYELNISHWNAIWDPRQRFQHWQHRDYSDGLLCCLHLIMICVSYHHRRMCSQTHFHVFHYQIRMRMTKTPCTILTTNTWIVYPSPVRR